MRNFQCIGIIKQFNIDKPGDIMTTNEVIEFLNSHGLPVDYRFFKVLKETTNVVQKVGIGRWVFDKNPIHYKTLQRAYDEYKFLKANKRNLYNKDNQIKDAIKLLKDNGYVIYKPI